MLSGLVPLGADVMRYIYYFFLSGICTFTKAMASQIRNRTASSEFRSASSDQSLEKGYTSCGISEPNPHPEGSTSSEVPGYQDRERAVVNGLDEQMAERRRRIISSRLNFPFCHLD